MIKTEQPANKVTRPFDYSAGCFSVSLQGTESTASGNLPRARRKISLVVNITFYKYVCMAVSRKCGTNTLNERVLKIQCKLYGTYFIIFLACKFSTRIFSHILNYLTKRDILRIMSRKFGSSWQKNFLFLSLTAAFIMFPFYILAKSLLSPTCKKIFNPVYGIPNRRIYARWSVTSALRVP